MIQPSADGAGLPFQHGTWGCDLQGSGYWITASSDPVVLWAETGGQIWSVPLGHKYSRKRTGKGDRQCLKGCWAFSPRAWKLLGVCAVYKTRAQKEATVAGNFDAQSVVDIY